MQSRLIFCIPATVLCIITLVYWPVVHASFVLDDVIDFVDMRWLSHGDDWKHYIFRDFNYWTNYFRPLVLALFTLQVRLFNNAPGPMHAVSLGMHLINTLLVGALSWRCGAVLSSYARRTFLLAASMLLYGLHPVLIEPVTWIGCQFDLAATMFMLLGLFANALIQQQLSRALTVAALFFLAACSKESAISFPLMLAIFDWALLAKPRQHGWTDAAKSFVHRNGLTYAAMFLAGMAYLAFRRWGLGQIVQPVEGVTLPWIGHFQEVCYLYLRYWMMLFWPSYGMNPIHEYPIQQFLQISAGSIFTDALAVTVVTSGSYLAIKRASPMACMILVMSCGLLPVLHIISTGFEPSLYHERYVMTSLAVLCAMVPLVRVPSSTGERAKLASFAGGTIVCLWLLLAVVGIRMTIPLWSTSPRLWQWVLAENPASDTAKNNLLIAYIESKDNRAAHRLIERLITEHSSCADCMLNAASFAVAERDPLLAARALDRARNIPDIAQNRHMYCRYLYATGQMLLLGGNSADAEIVLRNLVAISPEDPAPRLQLAKALIMQNKTVEANQVAQSAIGLLPREQQKAARDSLSQTFFQITHHAQTIPGTTFENFHR
jgi:Flp pilus assembly protein TadD